MSRQSINTKEQPTYRPGDKNGATQIRFDLDKLFRAVFGLGKEPDIPAATMEVVNNSDSLVSPGLLYGRNGTTGKVQLAIMGAAATAIVARWVSLTAAPPGQKFTARYLGPAEIRGQSATLAVVNYNTTAWVSSSTPGTISPSPSVNIGDRAQSVGLFSSLTASINGFYSVDLMTTQQVEVF